MAGQKNAAKTKNHCWNFFVKRVHLEIAGGHLMFYGKAELETDGRWSGGSQATHQSSGEEAMHFDGVKCWQLPQCHHQKHHDDPEGWQVAG